MQQISAAGSTTVLFHLHLLLYIQILYELAMQTIALLHSQIFRENSELLALLAWKRMR